jgi:hypothetical protein
LAAIPDEKIDPGRPSDQHDADDPPRVGLRLRAYPLLELLSAAARQKCDVMWESGAPLI